MSNEDVDLLGGEYDRVFAEAREEGSFRGDPLPKGTVVHIKDETDEWYEVVVESRGWVSKKFIKTV